MRTIWDVDDLKTYKIKIKKLECARFKINAEAKKFIKDMSDEEVTVTIKKVYPYYCCAEISGPHEDYYVVYSGISQTDILGTGDDKKQVMRDTLENIIWDMGGISE